MKKFVTVLTVCLFFMANAQVGINNTNPKANLDITASNVATPANTDGILIPRIDNFPATNPTADQNGMLVFVTGNGTPSKGFYYWNNASTSWISVKGAKKINDLLDGKSDNDGSQNGSSLFLGRNAGANDDSTDNKNVGIGFQSLNANTTGGNNTATGYGALYSNTTGDNNTVTGYLSLYSNATGDRNTAIGAGTLYSNTTGNKNVALGYRAGYFETGSNKLYIENSNADADNALIYGEFGTDNTITGNILRTNSQFQIGNPALTGYAFPTTDGTANQIMQTYGSGHVSFVNFNDVSTFAAAKIFMSADQSFTGSGWDKISFDTVNFDITTNFNTTNTRFNVTTAGIYRITASLHSNAVSNSTSSFGIAVYINGTLNKRVQMAHYGNGLIQRDISALINLAVSDKIEIYFYHTGAITIDSNGGKTSFEIERIR